MKTPAKPRRKTVTYNKKRPLVPQLAAALKLPRKFIHYAVQK